MSTPATFTLTVNPVNDVPSFTKGADQVISEDAGAQTEVGAPAEQPNRPAARLRGQFLEAFRCCPIPPEGPLDLGCQLVVVHTWASAYSVAARFSRNFSSAR